MMEEWALWTWLFAMRGVYGLSVYHQGWESSSLSIFHSESNASLVDVDDQTS